VQQWRVEIDHIHVVLVISPKYAVSRIVGKMKANVSRQPDFGILNSREHIGALCCGLLDSSPRP